MEEFVEPHVRRLVAEHLGVGVEELLSGVSLRDDLAADSLDLVELALALEGDFAIVVPERVLDDVRTFGDLVRATGVLIRARCEAAPRAEPVQRIWARIVPAAGESSGTLERTGWLTPYTVETIGKDAVRAGPGARLELTITADTTEGFVRAQRQLAGFDRHGVLVSVQRDEGPAVTVTGCAGDDPWQADDLTARVGQAVKRFGDGTPAEQTQATGHTSSSSVTGGVVTIGQPPKGTTSTPTPTAPIRASARATP